MTLRGTRWFSEERLRLVLAKNPSHLASTVLWHSNRGRHYPPRNGRHRGVLGVEDVTAHFHSGLGALLAPNPWKGKNVPTSLTFAEGKPTRIPCLMGVAALPEGFETVRSISRTATGIRPKSASVRQIDHAVDTAFPQ